MKYLTLPTHCLGLPTDIKWPLPKGITSCHTVIWFVGIIVCRPRNYSTVGELMDTCNKQFRDLLIEPCPLNTTKVFTKLKYQINYLDQSSQSNASRCYKVCGSYHATPCNSTLRRWTGSLQRGNQLSEEGRG